MNQFTPQFHFLFLSFFLSVQVVQANRIPEYETTRLKSTGGAGIASILMHESTLLNPAPIAFFNSASFYYQRDSQESDLTTSGVVSEDDSSSNGFIVTDSKGRLNGSLSYLKQNYRSDKRKTIGASLASVFGEKSSFGMSFNRIEDEFSSGKPEETYNVMNFGVTHVLNENFIIGTVLKDPFKGRQNNTRVMAGVQYLYKDFITLLGDFCYYYNENLSDNVLWKAAIQLKIFKDFYLRAGTFDDKGYAEKGNGAGLSWVGPKLSLDVAVKNTDRENKPEIGQTTEEIKEMVFSAAIRF